MVSAGSRWERENVCGAQNDRNSEIRPECWSRDSDLVVLPSHDRGKEQMYTKVLKTGCTYCTSRVTYSKGFLAAFLSIERTLP